MRVTPPQFHCCASRSRKAINLAQSLALRLRYTARSRMQYR